MATCTGAWSRSADSAGSVRPIVTGTVAGPMGWLPCGPPPVGAVATRPTRVTVPLIGALPGNETSTRSPAWTSACRSAVTWAVTTRLVDVVARTGALGPIAVPTLASSWATSGPSLIPAANPRYAGSGP